MNELEEIKNRIDVAEFIGGYVQLKQAGKNFKGLCPFHNEKTPSFVVSPERQMWHCFGSCGEGGDIFSFLMKIEGLSFPEAVKALAEKAGVQLKNRSYEQDESKVKLYEANELAADFYHAQLGTPAGKKAKEYFAKKRKLTEKIIKEFCLGYAPSQKDILQKELETHKFGFSDLEKAGLVAKKFTRSAGGQGEARDFFWNRLMFPIHDISGRTVGFSARVLDDSLPKYINTPETDIYHKSNILYGIDLAKGAIRKSDYAIVVEGMMDAIASYQAGIKNVVAPGGTALTENQLRLLGRLTKNLKLAFDIDFAGSEATRRAIELAWNLGFNIKIIVIPDGKDPAEAIAKDPIIWKNACKNSIYVVDYLFDTALKKYKKNDTLGKKHIAKDLLPVIKRIPEEIERDTYIKRLAKELSVSEAAIHDGLSKVSSSPKNVEKQPVSTVAIKNKNDELEKSIIGLLLAFPHYLDFAQTVLGAKDFTNPEAASTFEKILSYYNKKGDFSESKFVSSLPKGERDQVSLYTLAAESEFADFDDEKKAEEIYFGIKRLKKIALAREKNELSDKIAAFEKSGQKDEAKKALSELQKLLEEEKEIS